MNTCEGCMLLLRYCMISRHAACEMIHLGKFAQKNYPRKMRTREEINRKNLSFRHCPNHLNPPHNDPNLSDLVLFFLLQYRRHLNVATLGCYFLWFPYLREDSQAFWKKQTHLIFNHPYKMQKIFPLSRKRAHSHIFNVILPICLHRYLSATFCMFDHISSIFFGSKNKLFQKYPPNGIFDPEINYKGLRGSRGRREGKKGKL